MPSATSSGSPGATPRTRPWPPTRRWTWSTSLSPHPMHCGNCLLLLEHGKAVLCEKPFTINAAEARRVIESARRRELFLMEAMWARFIPAVARARELIAEGAIGDPRMVQADFGFRAGVNPEGRLFNLDLGGGALLDIGIYVLSLASMVLGPHPEDVATTAHLGETGVDEQSGDAAALPGGRAGRAQLRRAHPHAGGGAHLRHRGFPAAPRPLLQVRNPHPEAGRRGGARGAARWRATATTTRPWRSKRCLREGRVQSEAMPLDESLALMELMDRIRAQWGLVYPTER